MKIGHFRYVISDDQGKHQPDFGAELMMSPERFPWALLSILDGYSLSAQSLVWDNWSLSRYRCAELFSWLLTLISLLTALLLLVVNLVVSSLISMSYDVKALSWCLTMSAKSCSREQVTVIGNLQKERKGKKKVSLYITAAYWSSHLVIPEQLSLLFPKTILSSVEEETGLFVCCYCCLNHCYCCLNQPLPINNAVDEGCSDAKYVVVVASYADINCGYHVWRIKLMLIIFMGVFSLYKHPKVLRTFWKYRLRFTLAKNAWRCRRHLRN